MIAAELRGGNKPSLNEALGWIGWRVDDIFGAGVGRLEDVWIDPGTGEPRWLLVNAGRFGGRSTLIPFDDATAGTGHVWVPYEREIVLGAPAVEPGAPLTDQVETELHDHYSMHARSAGAEARGGGVPGALGELRYREPDPGDALGAAPGASRWNRDRDVPPAPDVTDAAASAAPEPPRPGAAASVPGPAPRLPARPAPPSPASASRDPQASAEPGPGPAQATSVGAQPAAGWQHDYSEAARAEPGRGGAQPAAASDDPVQASAEPGRQMVEIQLAGNLTIRGELVNLRIFSSDSE